MPIVAVLLAVTIFWAPARDLFGFGALEPQWLVVPLGAGAAVLVILELLKPIWRAAIGSGQAVTPVASAPA